MRALLRKRARREIKTEDEEWESRRGGSWSRTLREGPGAETPLNKGGAQRVAGVPAPPRCLSSFAGAEGSMKMSSMSMENTRFEESEEGEYSREKSLK